MKEFIEKLIGRLEEISVDNTCSDCPYKAKCDEVQEHINDETTDLCGATIKALSIEIVNQIAEEYNNGWIPVDKTLPKKSGYYTVTEEQYSLDMRKKMGVRVSHEVQFDAEEQRWHRAKFLKVIAWKEHETPYQPKGE